MTREETGCKVRWPGHIDRKCGSWGLLQVCKFDLVAIVVHGYKWTRCVKHSCILNHRHCGFQKTCIR